MTQNGRHDVKEEQFWRYDNYVLCWGGLLELAC